jgi:L-malate glycosyltransferase
LRAAERHLAASLSNAQVLCNPVNLDDPSIVPWPVGEQVRFASVARLETLWKGQDILFEVLSSAVWRDRDWQLSLCGEGPDREYLQALASHFGIANRISFLGHVQDIREIWSHHQLLVLPSRAEGTPLALVEAQLCGRPSVVTDVGDNTVWVVEQQTGFVAEAPTSRSFGHALNRAWESRAAWQEIGLRSHSFARERIDSVPGRTLLDLLSDSSLGKQRAERSGRST